MRCLRISKLLGTPKHYINSVGVFRLGCLDLDGLRLYVAHRSRCNDKLKGEMRDLKEQSNIHIIANMVGLIYIFDAINYAISQPFLPLYPDL